MRHINSVPKQHTFEFDSWQEFVTYASECDSHLAPSTGQSSYSSNFRKSRMSGSVAGREYGNDLVKYWNGFGTFEEAVDKSLQGWTEGAAELAKAFNNVQIPQQQTRQEFAFAPVGPGTLAMGRYIQGHPEPWMVRQDSEVLSDQSSGNGKIVHLGINISQSGGVSATERFQIGAVLLSLVDMLERNGKRVELTLFNGIGRNNDGAYCRIAVKVKRADSSVNMSVLAVAFANASTQRRLCWSVRESMDEASCRAMGIGGGYGNTDPKWHTNDCTFIKGLDRHILGSSQATKRWLQDALQEQGIEWDGE